MAFGNATFRRLLLSSALIIATSPVCAQIPSELQGEWSTDRQRCQQINGEVDVLSMGAADFAFYEIGCTVARPAPRQDGISFSAQCQKGGSQITRGTADFRRTGRDTIVLALKGFPWGSSDGLAFHRCQRKAR
jgi:hypothetical protein